jgi:hypothetical protein
MRRPWTGMDTKALLDFEHFPSLVMDAYEL